MPPPPEGSADIFAASPSLAVVSSSRGRFCPVTEAAAEEAEKARQTLQRKIAADDARLKLIKLETKAAAEKRGAKPREDPGDTAYLSNPSYW